MSSWEGVLRRLELESGVWVLDVPGARFALAGAVPPGLEGQRVRVTGRLSEGFGFAMTGDPTVEVRGVAPIPD